MKRLLILSGLLLSLSSLSAQTIKMLKAQDMGKWGIPAGNYSGISHIEGNRYAIVNDKATNDGWYEFDISIDNATGKVKNVELIAFHSNTNEARDAEGIVYSPKSKTIFISAENDQCIMEYDMEGDRTGRELVIPAELQKDRIYPNYGFEALALGDDGVFYTCTESTLKADGKVSTAQDSHALTLRIQSFGADLKPLRQFVYTTDVPKVSSKKSMTVFGVPEITTLPDGRLLVMERECTIRKRFIGSYVINKVYAVETDKPGEKVLMAEWKTKVNITKRNIANYEGMCLGPRLDDGRQTVFFISDSQNGYGNSVFHLKDYIRVGIIE